jgi:cellobiose-specific phosphotransferase system component IIA
MLRLLTVLVLTSMGLIACAGAPVQEMSNARQAIKAARDAGADKAAPDKLTEAEALLERAEQNLQKRDYSEARRDALAARSKASQALSAVQPPGRNGAS